MEKQTLNDLQLCKEALWRRLTQIPKSPRRYVALDPDNSGRTLAAHQTFHQYKVTEKRFYGGQSEA